MTTQSEVATLLPLLTPYSLPEGDAGTALYNHTHSRVLLSAPTLSGDSRTEAICYLIAHILCSKEGRAGLKSERLGQWSAAYDWEGSTPYLDEYSRIIRANLIRTSTQVEHNDTAISAYLRADNLYPGVRTRGGDDGE